MVDVRQLVRERLKAADMTMADASRRIGRNHAYLQQFLERSVPQDLPERVRERLAPVLGVRPDDLRSGSDGAQPPPPATEGRRGSARISSATFSLPMGEPDIPVLGVVAGGREGDFSFNGATIDYVRRPSGLMRAERVFAVHVIGESMRPRFNDGDLVVVHEGRPIRSGDDVLIEMRATDGEVGVCMIKRLVRRTATGYKLMQFTPPAEFDIEGRDVKDVHHVLTVGELIGMP